jgi:uncharacterized membrane protein
MERLFTPEHLHALLNHLPAAGILACSLFLLYGLVRKNVEFIVVAQILIVVFSAATFLVMTTGVKAQERFDHAPFNGLLDGPGKDALTTHENQARLAALGAYGLAVVTVAVLIVGRVRPALRVPTGWLILLGCVLVILFMCWVASSGGQIRHPEFRSTHSLTS